MNILIEYRLLVIKNLSLKSFILYCLRNAKTELELEYDLANRYNEEVIATITYNNQVVQLLNHQGTLAEIKWQQRRMHFNQKYRSHQSSNEYAIANIYKKYTLEKPRDRISKINRYRLQLFKYKEPHTNYVNKLFPSKR